MILLLFEEYGSSVNVAVVAVSVALHDGPSVNEEGLLANDGEQRDVQQEDDYDRKHDHQDHVRDDAPPDVHSNRMRRNVRRISGPT